MKKLLIFFLLFLGCSHSSLEEVNREASEKMSSIAQDLKAVNKKEDLVKILPSLCKKFEKLTDLIILADSFSSDSYKGVRNPHKGSEMLLEELKRIYQLHGGRELIEKAQLKGLKKLEKYQNSKKVLR